MSNRGLRLIFAFLLLLPVVSCTEEEGGSPGTQGSASTQDAGTDFRVRDNVEVGFTDDVASGSDQGGPPLSGEDCTNGLDDDDDGRVDCGDDDCTDHASCDSGPGFETDCGNDDDEDGDGRVDCDDSDCSTAPECDGGGTGGPEVCTGGADEDGDGLIDCFDGDCSSDPACAPTVAEDCFNGYDDDDDTAVDCDDSDCLAACSGGGGGGGGGTDEICLLLCLMAPEMGPMMGCDCSGGGGGGGFEINCSDNVDDDGDGLVDCDDTDCFIDPSCG